MSTPSPTTTKRSGSIRIPAAYDHRGLAYRSKGDHDRSIADFSEAIRLDPKFAAAYYHRGRAHQAKADNGPRDRRFQ